MKQRTYDHRYQYNNSLKKTEVFPNIETKSMAIIKLHSLLSSSSFSISVLIIISKNSTDNCHGVPLLFSCVLPFSPFESKLHRVTPLQYKKPCMPSFILLLKYVNPMRLNFLLFLCCFLDRKMLETLQLIQLTNGEGGKRESLELFLLFQGKLRYLAGPSVLNVSFIDDSHMWLTPFQTFAKTQVQNFMLLS